MNIKTQTTNQVRIVVVVVKNKKEKNEMKYKESIGGLCGCNLPQICEGVVGFERLSNLAHVGDLVLSKTVNSSFNKTHNTQNKGK